MMHTEDREHAIFKVPQELRWCRESPFQNLQRSSASHEISMLRDPGDLQMAVDWDPIREITTGFTGWNFGEVPQCGPPLDSVQLVQITAKKLGFYGSYNKSLWRNHPMSRSSSHQIGGETNSSDQDMGKVKVMFRATNQIYQTLWMLPSGILGDF